MALTKEQAVAVFDALEEGGLRVSLRKYGTDVNVGSYEDPHLLTEGESGYEVEVELVSLRSAERLELLAKVVREHQVSRIVPEFGGMVIR